MADSYPSGRGPEGPTLRTSASKAYAALREGARVLEECCHLAERIAQAAEMVASALGDGCKLLLFGNGGSAADCQHIAAEIVGRFKADRQALPAVALTTDTSVLTAVANDYGFEAVFTRQIEALGQPGDVALALSTSGQSQNIIAAVKKCRQLGIKTIALTGADGQELGQQADLCIAVPHQATSIIQQAHMAIGHFICEVVERQLCSDA